MDNHCHSALRTLTRLHEIHGPVHLIAHSFSTVTALWLAHQSKALLDRMTILTPALHMRDSFCRILEFAREDFQNLQDPRALELSAITQLRPLMFDQNMQKGYEIALQDPRLGDRYWKNSEARSLWEKDLMLPGGGYDLQTSIAVLQGLNSLSLHSLMRPLDLPVQLIFGAEDRIIFMNREVTSFQGFCSQLTYQSIAGTAHFPHLENPELFFEALLSFSNSTDISHHPRGIPPLGSGVPKELNLGL